VTTPQVAANIDGMAERSARWLRVSTNRKGAKQQDESQQIPDVERWETGHGYDVQKTFTIHGASAYKGNKTFDDMWARVIKDITNGVFTVLVVWKTNRIDRKLQTYQMIREVVEAGGRIEFVMQPHLNDLSTMAGRVALKIEEEIAYGESKNKSDDAKRTLANHRTDGAINTRPPFGYEVEGEKHHKSFVIVESRCTIVETIFDKCIAGDSLVTIAKWLDSEGIPTARGGKWSASALKNIINNRAYMGYITDDHGKTIGKCPVIIDADIFRAANNALSARPNHGPIIAGNRALLASVLYCPVCRTNSPMYRIKAGGNSGGQAYYYRCAGRGAQRKGCGNMVRLADVDALVDEKMSAYDESIMKHVYIPGHNHEAAIGDVDYRISQLSPEGLTRAEYQAKLDELWDEKEALKELPTVDDDWDWVKTGETYSGKWAASDADGKRDMLKKGKVYAGKNERGEAWVGIELINEKGQLTFLVGGNPPGQSLLERAAANGIVAESHADLNRSGFLRSDY
jgi:DNA invertase Pin-like site-specific DNA recombinase